MTQELENDSVMIDNTFQNKSFVIDNNNNNDIIEDQSILNEHSIHIKNHKKNIELVKENRLKRLTELCSCSEEKLSLTEKKEKKRIIHLEKNRLAAIISRKKKKMYIKQLEETTVLMAQHLAILEMENANLKAILLSAQEPSITRFEYTSDSNEYDCCS